MIATERVLPRLIATTSTCPRWAGDAQPDFVLALCQRLCSWFRVTLLAPHAAGSKETERLGEVDIVRYRYAPESLELLAYEAGLAGNLRVRPWLIGFLPLFLRAQRSALLRLVAQEEGPTVVHSHWLFPQGWLAARALSAIRTPLVVTAHGSDVLALRGSFWDRLHRETLARAARVTAVGPEVADRLDYLDGRTGRVELLPLGVDITHFASEDVVRETGCVLMAGRLAEGKGGDVLLRAIARLRDRGCTVRVIVAGEGAAGQDWQRLAESLGLGGQIDFVGWLDPDALRGCYRRAVCCVFPSLSEGFGLSLVEALACETPVLASDLPAFRYIDGGSECIRFFPPGNDEALASQLASLLAAPNLRVKMGLAGRACARRFAADVAAEQYARILSEAIAVGAEH